MIVNLLSA